ncbi:hypothetical protein [Georgenia yuyongxinii]
MSSTPRHVIATIDVRQALPCQRRPPPPAAAVPAAAAAGNAATPAGDPDEADEPGIELSVEPEAPASEPSDRANDDRVAVGVRGHERRSARQTRQRQRGSEEDDEARHRRHHGLGRS